VKSRSHIL